MSEVIQFVTNLSSLSPSIKTPVLDWLNTTAITIVAFDNSRVMQQLEESIRALEREKQELNRTIAAKRIEEERTRKLQNETLERSRHTVQLEREIQGQRLTTEIQATMESLHNRKMPDHQAAEAEMFQCEEVRDDLIKDPEVRAKAISLGLLIIQPDGSHQWSK